MKKLIFSLSVLLLSVPVMAQRVLVDNFDQLKVHFSTPEITVTQGDYLTLDAADYILGGELGAPALPMHTSLLTVPFCEGMSVEVTNAVYDTLSLPAGRVMPLQPSRRKSDLREEKLLVNESVYAADAFFSRPLASVKPLGIGRDRRYAVLTWSPVSVNPVTGTLVVCRRADVTVHYLGSDASATIKHFERYYTPAFSLAPTLNNLVSAKDVRSTAPVRMVIMALQRFQCAALDEFVAWKRRQGMLVDLHYLPAGTTSTEVAAQLQQMYDNASETAPAPTYLILVGDHGLLPAFGSDLSASTINALWNYASFEADHVTDLYYTTWSANDKVPDCYQGRFSANDTNTLRKIIEKTLYYERYQFINDNYLGRAALVAGEDNGTHQTSGWYKDNAWIYSDPTMDYVAKMYINADNGYDTVYYYKNDTTYAPAGVTVTGYCSDSRSATVLRTLYSQGLGWINYSAHGDWNCWYKPSFTVSHVNQMHNNDMPSFMIGNCCLSNKFDEGTCFGEALLRKGDRAGAIGYIGATNSTFWTEDFYWSVGVRNSISHQMNLIYEANRKGMYDRLFHTHNEDLSDHMVTAGKMLVAGNLSVNRAAGSSTWADAMVEYYWEIYELMGDPSLMPWLGKAKNLTSVSMTKEDNMLQVNTVPGSYVALLADNTTCELLSSSFADANGVATLSLGSASLANCYVAITAQGYKPYLVKCSDAGVGLNAVDAAAVTVSPNPAGALTEVAATGLRSVTLLNMMGQALQTVNASADRCTVGLASVPAGLYLLRIETAAGTSVKKLVVK